MSSTTIGRKYRPIKWIAAFLAAIALAFASLVVTANAAKAHTADLDVDVSCVAGEYVVTYTLTFSSVPSGATAVVEARSGDTSFSHGWNKSTWGDWAVKASDVPSTQTTVSWTETLPGTTSGDGPWQYVVTTWSTPHVVLSDSRAEGLAGDCIPDPTVITGSYTPEQLTCTAGSRNWLHLDGATGGVWTISSTLGSTTLNLGEGFDGAEPNGATTSYPTYTVELADGDASDLNTVTPLSFTWTPVNPGSLHCVTWETCPASGSTATSYDMAAWPVTDIRSPGVGEINDDQPRSGFGSLMLDTSTSAAKVQYVQPVTPFPYSDLTQMEYETFVTTPGVAMGSLQLRYTSVSKGLTGDFNFIVFEPYVDQGNAAIVMNTWQHWDAYRGGDALVWSNRGATLGIASQGAPTTHKAIDAAVNDIMITGYVINQGSGNANTLSYVDNVGFAKKGQPCGLVNFEPAPTVVPPTPTGSIVGECVPSPGTGTQGFINASNPSPTAPNTVTTAIDLGVRVDGVDTTQTISLAPGASVTNVPLLNPPGEDSYGGSVLIELTYGKDVVASVVINTNCADDVITTPTKVVPTPPDCKVDGVLPNVPNGDYYTVVVSPSGTGPGTYTITATADAKFTFASGKTFTYEVVVLPKLVKGCETAQILALTGSVASVNAWILGSSLFVGGLIVLMWTVSSRRRQPE